MKNLNILTRKTAFIVILIYFVIVSSSCIAGDEPAFSLEDIARFATETQQALPAEEFAAPTPLPNSTLVPSPTSFPPTVTALPTSPPILPTATRINFIPGATYGIVTGTIEAGKTQDFVLGALIGQPLQASVSSPKNDVTMSIITANGVELLAAEQKSTSWQGSLPATQDYFFQLLGGAGTQNFTFWVSIPSRIQFDVGAISETVSGKTIDGNIASYVVAAQGGQTMDIQLTANPDVVALTVWGFNDGQPYIRAVMGSTTFNMQLPSTQDYIINVVPQGRQEVNFSLEVEIK